MDQRTSRQGFAQTVLSFTLGVVLALSLLASVIPAGARTNFAEARCGDGSAPDYGFSYGLQQPHWTVGWRGYASERVVTAVDEVLDRLNADSIAQTMILILPQEQVGNRVNCAVHFLRYMKLGLPTGERKDNGFVFLIVVEPDDIDVHYGVGLGLPALTAAELTSINRAAEAAYQSTGSIDQALLTIVGEFDTLARSDYDPLVFVAPTPREIDLPPLPSGPLGFLMSCGMLCLGFFFLMLVMGFLGKLGRMGGPGPRSPWSGGFPRGRGGGSSWGGGFPRIGGRGGSGSGRSGRGN